MTDHNIDRECDRDRFWGEHDIDEYHCPNCGRGRAEVESFEVHHVDENPANGEIENLVALCQSCHWDEHGMAPGKRPGHWSEGFFNEYKGEDTPLKYI
jgi:5-methylcytosine-specific restriction endonuclease McrA